MWPCYCCLPIDGHVHAGNRRVSSSSCLEPSYTNRTKMCCSCGTFFAILLFLSAVTFTTVLICYYEGAELQQFLREVVAEANDHHAGAEIGLGGNGNDDYPDYK